MALDLILASTSPARRRLLADAGIAFEAIAPDTDEDAVRRDLSTSGITDPARVAAELAGAKAASVSASRRDALVIGADQILALDGQIFTKPADAAAAREQLMALRGKTHTLHSAVCVAHAGSVEWSLVTRADLTMREFSTVFLERYLAEMADRVTSTVGGYEIEGRGIQLFRRIEGDLFTIQGLPLLDLLGWLRRCGVADV